MGVSLGKPIAQQHPKKAMHSLTPMGKAPKGSVTVLSSNGRLQLRFRYGGKRHYLSTGFNDNKNNRRAAERLAHQIELDICSGNFDPSLAKYKAQSVLSTAEQVTPITPKLSALWGDFMEFKRSQCSQNTMDTMYGQYTRYVERLPVDDLVQAAEIRDYVLQVLPLNSAKRFLIRLNACCKWSLRSGRIKTNPFENMAQEIKLPKAQGKGEDDINPFTAAERDAIIEALESDRFVSPHSGFKHSYYAPFVRFSFLTGCRPSEAVALTWGKISKNFGVITFDQAMIDTSKGRKVRDGLKTQERRKFPCNSTMKVFLATLKPITAKASDLVFPGVRGGYLDPDAFRKYVWTKVLNGLGLEYRKPYQSRHTFINLMLENGLDAKDVARLVGNSAEVVYRHYAGNKRELFVPEV